MGQPYSSVEPTEEQLENAKLRHRCRYHWYASTKDPLDRHAEWEECMAGYDDSHLEVPPMIRGKPGPDYVHKVTNSGICLELYDACEKPIEECDADRKTCL